MRKKRPDYHTVKEYLTHEFEARVRGLWMKAAEKSSLEELKAWLEDPQRTVDDVKDLGKRMQQERISKQAVSLYEIEMLDDETDSDPVFLNTLIQNRDLELFWDLRHAVKHGHVGHMEDLLPELLVFFSGSKNSNYAKEMYELLQIMRHETTPEIRHAIREHCFLVNMEGRSDSFYPIDQRQEINNRGILEYGPAPQGRTTWEDYEKICPLVPFFTKFTRHFQDSVEGIQKQSHIHKVPAWEKDLITLARDHAHTKLLTPVSGREFATKSDQAKDFYKQGSISLQNSKSLANYATKRQMYFKSRVTTNDFSYYHERSTDNDDSITQTTPPFTPPESHRSWSPALPSPSPEPLDPPN
ncbi:unnamed protein product [Rhizoctonia solani]|uniref:DUF6589 domain-containing protein n=2 Tax=Rhizoctonia solani TaxID=456999 RepID=A0A8H3C5N8_9AGAM|nr:unnamed protein product [Rhizoctonia solani]CAE6474499.1 unnamed protein product [Rhizoctonia solani]